jgi:hypothetical protein
MDIKEWKSVAVRADKYKILKGLCKKKYRTPGAFVEKLIDDYITFQAKKEKLSEKKYRQLLLEDG